jgi:hypothetical protein
MKICCYLSYGGIMTRLSFQQLNQCEPQGQVSNTVYLLKAQLKQSISKPRILTTLRIFSPQRTTGIQINKVICKDDKDYLTYRIKR